jgi:hypothetical protein
MVRFFTNAHNTAFGIFPVGGAYCSKAEKGPTAGGLRDNVILSFLNDPCQRPG